MRELTMYQKFVGWCQDNGFNPSEIKSVLAFNKVNPVGV